MDAAFPEFYRPSAAEFAQLSSKAVLAFDANMLLNAYRYSEETRTNLFAILRRVRKQIWLPHQAALGNLGAEQDRSVYDEGSKIILINLDHPMVEAAVGLGGVEDVAFTRLSYEIAFGQYALAVSQEFLKRDPDLTADDVLYEVRDTMRRITRKAANLYQQARSAL